MSQIIVRDLEAYAGMYQPRTIIARDLVVYAVDQSAPIAEVRKVTGALLRDDPAGQRYRKLTGALLRPVRKPDFTKDGAAALYAAVNQEFTLSMDATKIAFSNPRAATGDAFNSLVTCTPVAGSQMTGSIDFRYDRYHLSDAFAGKSTSSFTVSADTTVFALLATINSTFNLALTQADVQDGVATANQPLVLQSGTASLYFLPGGSITLGTA